MLILIKNPGNTEAYTPVGKGRQKWKVAES